MVGGGYIIARNIHLQIFNRFTKKRLNIMNKMRNILTFTLVILGIQSFCVLPAQADTSNITQSNKVLIDKVENGEHIYWTQGDQDLADQRHAEFNALIKNQQIASGSAKPKSNPDAPPFAAQSAIGTGNYSTTDFLNDASESTGKDSYLILENANANTCGPIAAHNLLTHFGPALDYKSLGSKVGYTGSQTPWSSQYATGLNSQESSYKYTAFGYVSSSTSAWDSTYYDLTFAVGVFGVPSAMNPSGKLPKFNHSVGHWVVGFGYSGWYNSKDSSSKIIKYFDSSKEHSGTYWFDQSEASLSGITINGIVA